MEPHHPSTPPVVGAIRTYPLKGGRAVAAETALVTPRGLAGDRLWLVVDTEGRFVSQRSHPLLATLVARASADGLRLEAEGRGGCDVALPDGRARLRVRIWKDTVEAALADPAAGRWLSKVIGPDCRLVYQDRPDARPLPQPKGRPGDAVSFADGSPVLLCGESSLDDLNARLGNPLPMDRFRPNLVVAGAAPFAEDGWDRLAIGEAVFRNTGPCPRCSVTTVDQVSGRRAAEPLRTLAAYRRQEGGVMFGVNLVPERTGRIRVGDPVEILR